MLLPQRSTNGIVSQYWTNNDCLGHKNVWTIYLGFKVCHEFCDFCFPARKYQKLLLFWSYWIFVHFNNNKQIKIQINCSIITLKYIIAVRKVTLMLPKIKLWKCYECKFYVSCTSLLYIKEILLRKRIFLKFMFEYMGCLIFCRIKINRKWLSTLLF